MSAIVILAILLVALATFVAILQPQNLEQRREKVRLKPIRSQVSRTQKWPGGD